MKKYVKSSSSAQSNYDKLVRTTVSKDDVTDYMCKLMLKFMDDDPDMTFAEALNALKDSMGRRVDNLVPYRLAELGIWVDGDYTLQESLSR